MFLPPECIEKLELYCIPLGLAPQNYSERQQRNGSQGSYVRKQLTHRGQLVAVRFELAATAAAATLAATLFQ
jgi:hypothetical protein